jgi:hypothetical protein
MWPEPIGVARMRFAKKHFEALRHEVKIASSDYVDMKQYEPAMRRLLLTREDCLNPLTLDLSTSHRYFRAFLG